MLTGIEFDALNVTAMERFWTEATQGHTGGLELRFAATDRPKADKNRLHLDLAGGPDHEREIERLLALGATRIDIGQGDVPWDVLADPEGNEFCVVRPGHHGVLAQSGLATICLDVAEDYQFSQSSFWQSETGWKHVTYYQWGVRLRLSRTSPVSLLMGPPAAPKAGRNRLRLVVTNPDWESGEFHDCCGNEFLVEG
ncbi:hypothetical protein DZF91_20905 [Actinomadura logoneensis]|uniref:Glyoxalase-like domain-containing protein n=1 Tax=Actinomadura logoneensis TaxID=2293572 RepID=A0A372JI78_9ACTN|nr:VOC family protein [Actinomadura logoneensis]RFU39721.1 hypothetical protein DZF91_20905 [Actinomadura logoneensis]